MFAHTRFDPKLHKNLRDPFEKLKPSLVFDVVHKNNETNNELKITWAINDHTP